ncbi:MAG: prenyltransferase [Clostridiales bacterium]|nr:prenyltransferase [Clostridiales bacterium]
MASYSRLTVRHALGLAAPQTWPASVFPVLLGTALSVAMAGAFSLPVFLLVLAASVLLQSSVNTINDYYDFVKGNDLVENSNDPGDAILVYNNVNPKHVKGLGFCFMAAALLLGAYPAYCGGFATLAFGAVGCFVIVAYSAGPKPVSYLPLGELVSGTVMGWFITAAVFSAFAGYLVPEVFFLSLPLVFGIGLIMMTNNICDIERDSNTSRKTLPMLLGRRRAKAVYFFCTGAWIALVVVCTAFRFRGGLPLVTILLLASFPVWAHLVRLPFTPERREQCMGAIAAANLCADAAYVAAVLVHALREQLIFLSI